MIIAQPKDLIGAYVNVKQGLPADTPWGNFTALGLITGGRLVAGVIYNCCEGANSNMHVGAEGSNWMTPEFLYAAFDYPFNQLERRRVTAPIRSSNTKAIRFVENLGFKYEGTMKHYYEDSDMLFYGMLRKDCRFLERKAA